MHLSSFTWVINEMCQVPSAMTIPDITRSRDSGPLSGLGPKSYQQVLCRGGGIAHRDRSASSYVGDVVLKSETRDLVHSPLLAGNRIYTS
jgi:hypothetical protein